MLAVAFGARHSPIAIAESLAPTGRNEPGAQRAGAPDGRHRRSRSSWSPPARRCLQKWFAYTGHPSARDPYFLYAASNFGSMISLLGYPLFIEPNLSIVGQAWLFAVGFGLLAVMIFFCGAGGGEPDRRSAARLPAASRSGKAGSRSATRPALPRNHRSRRRRGRAS